MRSFILFSVIAVLGLPAICQGGKISEAFLQTEITSPSATRDIILEFPSVTDEVTASPLLDGLTGDDRSNKIVELMQELTMKVQKPVLKALKPLVGSESATPFWIDNKIAISGVPITLFQAIAAIPGDFEIREAGKTSIIKPVEIGEPITVSAPTRQLAVPTVSQWGVNKINAPTVWAAGYKGQNVTVAIIDTGLNAKHVAFATSYKNDSYSWYDAVARKTAPYDGHGHGTHCAGIVAGANGIGVAPEAKFIACKGLTDAGGASETTLTACGQWVACPSGSLKGCLGRPNVVSNSWGGASPNPAWFNKIITNWRTLNIIPVFAIGNSGPNCKTTGSPGNQPNVISVGATDPDDAIAPFSSRGDPLSATKKPEVAAPGTNIISASNKDAATLVPMSGTSMAAPNVAGAVALMLSAKPESTFDEIKTALTTTAEQPTTSTQECKSGLRDVPISAFPNSAYGMGRIDVAKAMGL